MQCEHEDLELTDESATELDIRMLPDSFLRQNGQCEANAEHILTVIDDLGDDTYHLCTEHMLHQVTNYIRLNQTYITMNPIRKGDI